MSREGLLCFSLITIWPVTGPPGACVNWAAAGLSVTQITTETMLIPRMALPGRVAFEGAQLTVIPSISPGVRRAACPFRSLPSAGRAARGAAVSARRAQAHGHADRHGAHQRILEHRRREQRGSPTHRVPRHD